MKLTLSSSLGRFESRKVCGQVGTPISKGVCRGVQTILQISRHASTLSRHLDPPLHTASHKMAPLLALLPLILLPLAATAHPLCDHMSKNKHLQKRGLSGNALVTRPIDWSKYKNETFTYRGRTWTVPNQNTSEPYFGGLHEQPVSSASPLCNQHIAANRTNLFRSPPFPNIDWNTVDGCNDDSYFYSCPDPSGVVLSYDDGPSEYTDTLLDILAAQGQKATLCVVGGWFLSCDALISGESFS